jgi:hypothetical protein
MKLNLVPFAKEQHKETTFVVFFRTPYSGSGDSSVGIATAWIQNTAGARDFSVFRSVQTGSEAHSVSYPMVSGSFILRADVAGT